MRSSTRFAVAIQLLGLSFALPSGCPVEAAARAVDTYDYVIVGGGVTGLVVANRLTEDNNSGLRSPYHGKDNHTDDPQSLFLSSKQVVHMTTQTFVYLMVQHML